MLRWFLILFIVINLQAQEFKVNTLYKCNPVWSNGYKASPRTKLRYKIYLRAVKDFNEIRITDYKNKSYVLHYGGTKKGRDYYYGRNKNKNLYSIAIDTSSRVYLKFLEGVTGYIELKRNKVVKHLPKCPDITKGVHRLSYIDDGGYLQHKSNYTCDFYYDLSPFDNKTIYIECRDYNKKYKWGTTNLRLRAVDGKECRLYR